MRTGYAREQRSVDWGGVWAGLVWTLGLMVLLSSLWLALAFGGSEVDVFANNIEWWLAGTAIASLLIGGIVAGWAPRARGVGAGLVNGMTVWGLLLTISLIIGVPSVLGGAAIVGDTLQVTNGATDGATGLGLDRDASLWATFWTALIGFATAALGGMIGGNLPKRDETLEPYDARVPERVDDERTFRGSTVPAHTHRGDDVMVVDDDVRDRTDVMQHEHDGEYTRRH
jgi:hypothetical protein